MDISAFYETLKKTGGYETPPDLPRRSLDRMFGGTAAWYYLKILRIVVSGSRIASRGAFDNQQWARHSIMILTAVEDCGGRLNISGIDNVMACKEPKVFIANHMSMAETFMFPGLLLLFGPLSTVVKESLVNYPVFGAIMRAVDPVVVSRKDPRTDLKEVLTKGEAMLRAGRSVLVFPQATRSADFDIATFNSLGVKLAAKAGAPVVPVALKTDYHGIGKVIRDLGPVDMSKTVYFKYGAPIKVEGNGRDAQEKVVAFITENVTRWGVKVLKRSGDTENRRTGE